MNDYKLEATINTLTTIYNECPSLLPQLKSWVVSSSNNSKSICLSVEASIALDKIVGRKQ